MLRKREEMIRKTLLYSVMPNLSRGESDTVVQPYNSMLALRRLAELADECIVIDNTALHAIAMESLKCVRLDVFRLQEGLHAGARTCPLT